MTLARKQTELSPIWVAEIRISLASGYAQVPAASSDSICKQARLSRQQNWEASGKAIQGANASTVLEELGKVGRP